MYVLGWQPIDPEAEAMQRYWCDCF